MTRGYLLLVLLGFTLAALKPANAKSKIAIIGGGASGISSAFLLKNLGYKDITIYESKDEVGGFALTVNYQGRAYDMATMFVPDASILGPGIPPVLKTMIDFTRMELVEAEDFQTLHIPGNTLSKFPEILEKYSSEDIKKQLIAGFAEMTKLAQCTAVGIDCIKCGVCIDLTETTLQFGIRKNIPAFADLLAYTGDGLGVGPSAYGWIGGSMVSHFWWTPVEIYRVLKMLGVTALTLPLDTPLALRGMFLANLGQGSKHWWHFKEGYQTFWQRLVEKADIDVKLSEKVTSLSKSVDGTKWVIASSSGKAEYDFVISTSAPQDAIQYLPDGDQKSLLQQATPLVPPNDMFLATVRDFPKELPDTVAYWPTTLGVGAPNLRMDGTPFFWQKRHNRKIVLAATYSQPTQTPDQVWQVVQSWTTKNLGFSLDKLLTKYRVVFPTGPHASVRPKWFATWPTLQGDNGLFVVGESMCGSGVPQLTACLASLLPKYFPIQVRNALTGEEEDNTQNAPDSAGIRYLPLIAGVSVGVVLSLVVVVIVIKISKRSTSGSYSAMV